MKIKFDNVGELCEAMIYAVLNRMIYVAFDISNSNKSIVNRGIEMDANDGRANVYAEINKHTRKFQFEINIVDTFQHTTTIPIEEYFDLQEMKFLSIDKIPLLNEKEDKRCTYFFR